MDEPVQKRRRVEREEWAKRVEQWRNSGLKAAEFAAELGINPRTLTYWAWTLKREAGGQKRVWTTKAKKPAVAPRMRSASSTAEAKAAFVEIASRAPAARFELEIGGRRLHIRDGFDALQLRLLLEVLETA